MKNLLLAAVMVFAVSGVQAQGESCYELYKKVFNKRGANPLKDGFYKNVVITVRNGDEAACYKGQVEVVDLKIKKVYVLHEDGSRSFFKKDYPAEYIDYAWTIEGRNGISNSKITKDGEMINIVFVDLLRKKEKPLVEADPTELMDEEMLEILNEGKEDNELDEDLENIMNDTIEE